jgi:hypothetical protein
MFASVFFFIGNETSVTSLPVHVIATSLKVHIIVVYKAICPLVTAICYGVSNVCFASSVDNGHLELNNITSIPKYNMF